MITCLSLAVIFWIGGVSFICLGAECVIVNGCSILFMKRVRIRIGWVLYVSGGAIIIGGVFSGFIVCVGVRGGGICVITISIISDDGCCYFYQLIYCCHYFHLFLINSFLSYPLYHHPTFLTPLSIPIPPPPT